MARRGRGPELVVFGEFYLDLVFCRLGLAPAWGAEVRAQEYTEAPGGGVATTALTARRLGAGVAMITRVGPDAAAHPAWRMLAAAGVDASATEVRRGMSTARSACVAFNGDRMIITHDPINQDLEAVLRRRPAIALMREWKWSPAEKAVARRAFNLALSRELDAVIREAKERANRITEAAGLWELEAWLGDQRRRIDRTFDYRYSVLPLVFASLLRDGRLTENDLSGLDPAKFDAIRHMVRS